MSDVSKINGYDLKDNAARTNIATLQENVSGMQENITSLQGDVSTIQQDVEELQESVNDKIYKIENIAALKSKRDLISGDHVKTKGFYNDNDGGSAYYRIRELTNADTVDEKTIFALYDNTLVAELMPDNEISVKQLGAKGDNTQNDSPYFQKAVSKFGGLTILVPSGTYLINEPINISTAHTKIKGVGLEKPQLIKATQTTENRQISYNGNIFDFNEYPSIFNLIFPENSNITHIEINNLDLRSNIQSGETKTHFGIIAPHCTYSNFKNIRFQSFRMGMRFNGWLNKVDTCSFFLNTYAIRNFPESDFISMKLINCYFNTGGIRIDNGKCSLYSCHADNGNPCFEFNNCKEISMFDCITETYSKVLQNTNSLINIYGGDFEGHSSEGAEFGGFFINQSGGKLFINNANIHFEDLAQLGDPADKNIVINNAGVVEVTAKITTPYEYRNYITGSNAITKLNDTVYSTTPAQMQKTKKTITAATKAEIIRLPFTYGKNVQMHLKGYGTYSHTAIMFDALITAVSTTSSGVLENQDIDVNDRCIISSKDVADPTLSITAERDTETNDLVVYYNCSQNYNFNVYTEIEYNNLI